MISVDTNIDEEGYNVNALIFLLTGIILWVLTFIIAIYLMAQYWGQLGNIWKISSALFMVLLSPIISTILVLLGVINNLQEIK